ncbi:PspC domain-containing protein [Sphingomonas flavalba]|uniref:PspC domain-containing protein n=1 Tax=Sphingomonas flavalba TaxID=2559804 RepID=UPI0039E1E66C
MPAHFTLDKSNARLMGVCSGFARMTGTDVTLIRVGLVLLTLLGLAPATILAYLLIGMVANAG